jgi:hypothetical protein
MSDANHIGDSNEMVIGDNDHGDSTPAPKCGVCGVPWVDHMGIMGVCLNNKALKEDLKDSLEAHDEMRLEIAQLTKERDEARRRVCYLLKASEFITGYTAEDHALSLDWDCYTSDFELRRCAALRSLNEKEETP